MKLHLPKKLFAALMACMATFSGLSTTIGTGFIAGGAMTIAFVAQEARAEDATHWDITIDHSADTLDITTGTFYLGNGSSDGKGGGDDTTQFNSGAISVSNGAIFQVHGWSDPVMDMATSGKQTINSNISLNNSKIKLHDGSYLFSGEVEIAGQSELIDFWDKSTVFSKLTGESSAVLKIHNGGESRGDNIRMITLTGDGGYAGQINSELSVLAINSEGALANAARVNISGSNILALNVNETLAGISGSGVIKLAKNVSTAKDNAYAITRNVTAADSVVLTISNDGQTSPVFSGTIDEGVSLSLTGGSLTLSGATLSSTIQVGTGAALTLSGGLILSDSMIDVTSNGFDVSVAVASGAGTVNATGVTSCHIEGAQRTGSFEHGLFKYTSTVYGVRVADEVVSAENVKKATGYVVEEGLTATVQNATSAGLASVILKNDSTLKLSSDEAVEYTGGSFNVSGVAKLELTGSDITWNKQITCADADSALQLTVTDGSKVLWSALPHSGTGQGVNNVIVGVGSTLTVSETSTENPIFNGNRNQDTTITLKEGATLNSGNLFGWYTEGEARACARIVNLEKNSTWNILSGGGPFYINRTTINLSGARVVLGDGAVMQFERPNGNDVNVISTTATAEQMSLITAAAGSATAGTLKFQNTGGVFDINRGSFTLAETNTADLKVDVAIVGGNKSLTKNGDGVLELTRANAYTGETNINGGTIKLSGAGTFGTNAVKMAAGTTLELASTESLTHANTFKGSAYNVVHSGTGTSTLTGLNVWDCSEVDVQAGTLKLAGNMVLGAWMKKAKIATDAKLDVSGVTALDYDGFKDWTLIHNEVQEDGTMLCEYELDYDTGVTGIETLTARDTYLSDDTTNHKLIYSKTISNEVVATWDKNWKAELAFAPDSDALSTYKITEQTGNEGYYRVDTDFTIGKTVGIVLSDENATGGYIVGGNDTTVAGGVGLVQREVWISAQKGRYDGIVGGNYANAWGDGASASFTGNTHIVVDGASVGHIIGGIHKDGRSPVFTGDTYISVKSGEVTGSIIGANTSAHNADTTFNGNSNIFVYVPLQTPESQGALLDGHKDVVLGGIMHVANWMGAKGTMNGDTNINVDLSSYKGSLTEFDKKIVGGNYNSYWSSAYSLNGNTNVVINTGAVNFSNMVVGGSCNLDASTEMSVNGSTSVDVTVGSSSRFSGVIVGGSYNGKWGANLSISGDTNVKVNVEKNASVAESGWIVGGSYVTNVQSPSTISLNGVSRLTLNGESSDGTSADAAGLFKGTVVAGHYLGGNSTSSIGSTSLSIDGGIYTGDVIAGTYVGSGSNSSVGSSSLSITGGKFANVYGSTFLNSGNASLTNGDSTITVTSTTLEDDTVVTPIITGNLVGGMLIGGKGTTALTMAEQGDVTLTINGAKVANVYGGSNVWRNHADSTVTQGAIQVNLLAGEVTGDVYAAGAQNYATKLTTESTEVTIHSGVALTSGKTISGGYGGNGTGSTVTGTRTLNLTGSGTRDITNLNIVDFDFVNVQGGTLKLTSEKTLSTVASMGLAAGSSLSLVDGEANGVLTLGGAATLNLLKTPAAEGVMLLAGAQTTPMLGDLAVKLPADWDTTDDVTDAITLIGGLTGVTLRGTAMKERVKASEVFTTLNGATFDTYKETYYLLMDTEDGALKLVNGSYGASNFYWCGGADDTWTSEKWATDDKHDQHDKDDYIYIQNVPHKEAVNAIFDRDTTQTIAIDTDAVVDTLTVTNGSYTFAQGTVDDGNGGTTPVGSLTIEDKLTIGDDNKPEQTASATFDMEATVKNIELASSAASLTVNKALEITGKLTATKGGTITNGLAAGPNSTLVLKNAKLGGIATEETKEIDGENKVVIKGNGVKLVGSSFVLEDVTITGQIDNSGVTGGTTLRGNIHLATNEMGKLLEGQTTTYWDVDATSQLGTWDQTTNVQSGTCNGYTTNGMSAQLFVSGGVNADPMSEVTWTMVDANGNTIAAAVSSVDGIVYSISSKDVGTEYVAGDEDTAAVYDKTDKMFSERATALVLNGGDIVLNTGLDKSEGSKLTGGIRAEQDGTVTISEGVTLDKADLNANGNKVTILGVGTYDLGAGTALSEGVGLGTDDPATTDTAEPIWAGTVTTSATAISDISGLGTADSAVALTSDIVTESLTTGTVGKVTVKSLVADSLESAKSDVSITGATTLKKDSTVGTAAFNGGLTLGTEDGAAILTGEELSLSTLNLANLDSSVEAARLSKESLDIRIDKSLLSKLKQGDYRTLVTLWDDDTLATLSFNGESDCTLEEKGAKYLYSIGWEETESVAPLATDDTTAGTNGEGTPGGTVDNVLPPADVVVLTTVQNPNYMKEKYSDMSENALAGADLLDDAFIQYDPQNQEKKGDIASIIDAVDNNNISQDDLAAVAGSSIATLGMALSGDVERQLRAIRNRTTSMGVNECVVNEGMPYFNAWVNAEGNRAELDKDETLAGYTLDSWGGTIGFDVDLNPNLTVGMAITAMYGDLQADGPETKAEGDMDTYYVSLFARYASCAWTHTFVATVGMMDGSFDRTVGVGNGYETEGTTDGMSFGLMYEVGYVMPLDEDATACLQPVFNVMLRHSTVGSYTEEGGDAALDVESQSMTTLTFGLGARLQAVVGESVYNRASIFEARVLGKVDVGDRESEADVAFAGGSGHSATVKSAELGAFGVELGAGLTIPMGDDDGSIFVDGSVEMRSGYTNFNGTVGYRINF